VFAELACSSGDTSLTVSSKSKILCLDGIMTHEGWNILYGTYHELGMIERSWKYYNHGKILVIILVMRERLKHDNEAPQPM
jgi:hypothetical protein